MGSPLLPRSHSRKPAQTRSVVQSTVLRLQLAAQLSSELPLLQSEEELTVRAKGPRLQPAEIFSELQPPRLEAETALLKEAEPLRQRAPAFAVLAPLELARPGPAKRSVAERPPFGAARSAECS